MSLLPCVGVVVGQNGESSHTAQRATAHHCLPGLAIQGHLPTERNGEPTTASSLKTARQSGLQAGAKAGAARTGCVSGAREGEPPQAASIVQSKASLSCVTTLFLT